MADLRARLQEAARSYQGLDRRIWVLAGVRGVNTMGLSLVMSFMGVYLVTARGLSGAAYGLVYLAANVFQALANSYTGHMSDRLGRRRLMVAAQAWRTTIFATDRSSCGRASPHCRWCSPSATLASACSAAAAPGRTTAPRYGRVSSSGDAARSAPPPSGPPRRGAARLPERLGPVRHRR